MPAKWLSFTKLRLFFLIVLSVVGAATLYMLHSSPNTIPISEPNNEGEVVAAAKNNEKNEDVHERNAQKKEEQQLKREQKQSENNDSSTSDPTPTPTPTPTPSPTPSPSEPVDPSPSPTPTPEPVEHWDIRSVSSMKETKDKVCGQPPREYIEQWVDRAKELGVNYISIATPYENPDCASALEYTREWVEVIRSRGLNVWHRHMPLAFEGIYSMPKNNETPYLDTISNYIKSNPNLFKKDDIFTPIPEPQNGGIQGITHCPEGVCQFEDAHDFNKWLRDAITVSNQAFSEIGLGELNKIGYYGFDGFVAWGHDNPDWNGILEDETISAMGNITIDHYPEIVGDSMYNSLDELEAKYPSTPIIIGEWGVISGDNYDEQIESAMGAAIRPSVVGFNYWHMGVGGNESLVNSSLSPLPPYFTVQSYFASP